MESFLFSDDEIWHKHIYANSWRHALLILRDLYQIKGKLQLILWDGDLREYRLRKSDYRFSLRHIDG